MWHGEERGHHGGSGADDPAVGADSGGRDHSVGTLTREACLEESDPRPLRESLEMPQNLDAGTLYEFIVGDFECAWNCLAANPDVENRGNFMFARQAMTLLEWAARLCASDLSGAALTSLSQALIQIEPLYFTELPGICADFRGLRVAVVGRLSTAEATVVGTLRSYSKRPGASVPVFLNMGLRGSEWVKSRG